MNPIVLEVAAKVRAEIELWAARLPEDTWEIAASDLAGCCGIASHMLKNVLAKLGIESQFVMGRFSYTGVHEEWELERSNHCWLVIDGAIVDITATQFGEEDKVFVTREDDRYYQIHSEAMSLEVLLNNWSNQSPNRYPKEMSTIHRKLTSNLRVAR